MSAILKNRDVDFIVVDLAANKEVQMMTLFVEKITYNLNVSGVTHKGLKKSSALQWYSSMYTFSLSGDSYISPFKIPTFLVEDANILKLYNLYNTYFHESTFELGKYGWRMRINHCPLDDDKFDGVFTEIQPTEDSDTGLIQFTLGFEGKSTKWSAMKNASEGQAKDENIGE